jgi:hypothetical protein
MAIFGDGPPRFIESDVYTANAIVGIMCRTDASRSAFIQHCYQEAWQSSRKTTPICSLWPKH